ncbi:MAG: alpha-L-arabinofuranosidase C-terminal domain-containing protein, partial [Limisphaerales bacterium]
VMFSTMHGNQILATRSENIPTREWQPRPSRGRTRTPQKLRQIFFDATRDRQSGTIYLKIVNEAGTPQNINIQISGASKIKPDGEATVLRANNPDDTNSIQEPRNIVPVTEAVSGLSANFTRDFPPYSITVLKLRTE